MMQKVSNEQALSFIDSFLGKVQLEKKAADGVDPDSVVKSPEDTGGGQPAGTVKAKVEGTTDTSPEKTKTEEKHATGATSAEKKSDIAGGAGTSVESAGAKNTEAKKGPVQGTFNSESAPDTGVDQGKEAEKLKVASEVSMKEMDRANKLAAKILDKVAELTAPKAEQAKQAAEQAPQLPPEIEKMAAEVAEDSRNSFLLGMMKRAEDFANVKAAMPSLRDEQINHILDKVAAEDPEAVLPAEMQAEAAREGEPVEQEAIEAAGAGMPSEMAGAAGAPAGDQAAEAEKLVADLIALGIPPELIEQAAMAVDQEGGAGAGPGMPPGAEALTPPPEGIPPEAMAQTGGIPAMASERDLQKQAEELERHFAILPPAWQHAIVKEAAEQQKAWFDKLPEDQKKVVLEKAAAEQFEALKQVVRDFRTGKLK